MNKPSSTIKTNTSKSISKFNVVVVVAILILHGVGVVFLLHQMVTSQRDQPLIETKPINIQLVTLPDQAQSQDLDIDESLDPVNAPNQQERFINSSESNTATYQTQSNQIQSKSPQVKNNVINKPTLTTRQPTITPNISSSSSSKPSYNVTAIDNDSPLESNQLGNPVSLDKGGEGKSNEGDQSKPLNSESSNKSDLNLLGSSTADTNTETGQGQGQPTSSTVKPASIPKPLSPVLLSSSDAKWKVEPNIKISNNLANSLTKNSYTIIFNFQININGTIDSVSIKKSSGNKRLDRVVTSQITSGQFIPFKRNGKLIAGKLIFPFQVKF